MKHVAAFLLMIMCAAAFHKGVEAETAATHPSLRGADLPRLIPAKEFYASGYKSWGHQLSPDGERLAWIERGKGKFTLRVRVLKSGHTVTMNHPALVMQFYWTLDSRHLLSFAIVGSQRGTRLFLTDTDYHQGQPRDLIPLEGLKFKEIITPPAKPASVLVQANLPTDHTYDLYEINLKTGVKELLGIDHGNTLRWIVSDKGNVLGRLQRDADGGWSVQAPAGNADWTTLLTGEFTDTIEIVQSIPDGRSRLYMLTSAEQDKRVLMTLDLNTSKQEVVFKRPDVGISKVFMDPIAYEPLVVRYDDGLPRYHYFDRKLQEDVERILGPGPMLHDISSGSLDHMRLTVVTETDRARKTTYLIDRRSGTKELLAVHPLEGYRDILSPTRPIRFKARDGLSISGYLTIPKGADGKRLPMVLKVHSGPWLRDRWGFDAETQFFANRGYAVLKVNFRGSWGFGKSFMEKGYKELGGKMQDDLIDAVDWAVAEGYADPDKVAIYGHSYGGYAALVGLTKTPGKFAAGISVAGFSDLLSQVSTFARREISTRAWWIHSAGDPDDPDARKDLRDRSPITYAHRVERPLLIVHGAKDKRVLKEHSDRFVEKLREKDIPVEYLVFRGERHRIRKRKNRLEFARRLETFLAKHLGGRTGPE